MVLFRITAKFPGLLTIGLCTLLVREEELLEQTGVRGMHKPDNSL